MKFRERLLHALIILLSDPLKDGYFAGACARCKKAFYVDNENNITNSNDHEDCIKEAKALALYEGLSIKLKNMKEGIKV